MKLQYLPQFGLPAFIFCTCFALINCETNFEPLLENDRYVFSMYASLDVYADTQWVRVMPILDTLVTQNPGQESVLVTLTRESTGETQVLNDSLFFYGAFAYAYNYWTAEISLYPGEEYRIRAENRAGGYSSAAITLPGPFPFPTADYTAGAEKGTVSGTGIENLVVAETTFFVQVKDGPIISPEFPVVFSHLEDAAVNENGDFSFFIDAWPLLTYELDTSQESIIINRREVLVASAREDWPALSGLDEEEISLPDVESNVENGTGVVAGIASRRILIIPN